MNDDDFPAAEMERADRTEEMIGSVLSGAHMVADPATASVVEGLARVHQVEVPERLWSAPPPSPAVRRPPLSVRVACGLLGAAFLVHGLPSVVDPGWVARFADLAPSPHAFREGGLAFVTVGGLLLAATFRARITDVAVAVGSGLAVAVGINGAGEIGSILHAEGGRLHLAELVLGLTLAGLWIRYRIGRRDEEGT